MTRLAAVLVLGLVAASCVAGTLALQWTMPETGRIACDLPPADTLRDPVWATVTWSRTTHAYGRTLTLFGSDTTSGLPGELVTWQATLEPDTYLVRIQPWNGSGALTCSADSIEVIVDPAPAGVTGLARKR